MGGVFLLYRAYNGALPPSVCSRGYWRDAAANLADVRVLAVAAMTVALRVAVKFLKVPLAAGLSLTFDCYVNAVGALICGPLAALLIGAVSDTVGCIVAPTGPYFFPFIFVEMTSGFLFALFFWRRPLTVTRTLAAKGCVNFLCNIVMNSVFIKWQCYLLYGLEEARAYNLVNLVRIGKNLILFPLEAVLILLLLRALLPPLAEMGLVPRSVLPAQESRWRVVLAVTLTFLVSVALVLFYIFFLKDFLSAHNVKWL